MEYEKIILNGASIEVSECADDADVLIGKFIICDFQPNKNGVQLDRNTILSWLDTLKDKPLVGKIMLNAQGESDFTSHNVKLVVRTDDFGNEYYDVEFDTSAFGTFTTVGLEYINGIEYIVAYAKIWKRFTNACEIIKSRATSGTLSTSWEISVIKQRATNLFGNMVRVIEEGSFLGHCLLGANIEPAFQSSRLLNVASKRIDDDLKAALLSDINDISKKEEDVLKKDKSPVEEQAAKDVEPVVEPETKVEAEVQTSALTEWDLRAKINDACRAKVKDDWCWVAFHFPIERTVWVEAGNRESELDYLMFSYNVIGEDVTVSDPVEVKLTVTVSEVNSTIEKLKTDVSARDEVIVKLNDDVRTLSSEIAGLSQYKERFEVMEQDRIEQETAAKRETLKTRLIDSKTMSEKEIEGSEAIKSLIANLDEAGVNKLISDKIISATAKSAKKPEVAQTEVATPRASLVEDDFDVADLEKPITHREFMGAYLGK